MSMSRFAVRALAASAIAGAISLLPLDAASAAPSSDPFANNPLVLLTQEITATASEATVFSQENLIAGLIDITSGTTGTVADILER